jgi:seryl-tRNA synthetase
MLEIKFVRENLSAVQQALSARGVAADIGTFKQFDAQRRKILREIEGLRHRRNVVSEQIAEMKKRGEDTDALVTEMRDVSGHIKELDKSLSELEGKVKEFLLEIPNIPHSSVAVGKDSADNPVLKQVGEPPKFEFEPQPHWTLGQTLGILDLSGMVQNWSGR